MEGTAVAPKEPTGPTDIKLVRPIRVGARVRTKIGFLIKDVGARVLLNSGLEGDVIQRAKTEDEDLALVHFDFEGWSLCYWCPLDTLELK